MLGSYPSLSLHDPKTYIANLVTLLSGYPLWAGERAINVVKRNSKFIPTEADIYQEIIECVKPVENLQKWERAVEKQIAERALPGPPPAKRLTYEELRAKYDGPNGEKWGIENPDFKLRKLKTPQQYKNELIAKIGKEAFDAIPDAPTSFQKVGS